MFYLGVEPSKTALDIRNISQNNIGNHHKRTEMQKTCFLPNILQNVDHESFRRPIVVHRLGLCSNKSRKTSGCRRVIENSFFIHLGVWITRIGVNKESIQLNNTVCRCICFGIGENDRLGRKGNITRGAIDPETRLNRSCVADSNSRIVDIMNAPTTANLPKR